MRFFADVSGLTWRTFRRRQEGHISHPSFTISLPHCCSIRNYFSLFSYEIKENILTPKTEKNRKARRRKVHSTRDTLAGIPHFISLLLLSK